MNKKVKLPKKHWQEGKSKYLHIRLADEGKMTINDFKASKEVHKARKPILSTSVSSVTFSKKAEEPDLFKKLINRIYEVIRRFQKKEKVEPRTEKRGHEERADLRKKRAKNRRVGDERKGKTNVPVVRHNKQGRPHRKVLGVHHDTRPRKQVGDRGR